MAKMINDLTMYKVRVYYKTPVIEKSGIMGIRGKTIKYYRSKSGKLFSPYKTISVIGVM